MIITNKCCIKQKTTILTELSRIDERLCTFLEEEMGECYISKEIDETLTVLGFQIELKPNKKLKLSHILHTELLNIIDELSKEIENKDLTIKYNKKYYLIANLTKEDEL